MWHFCYIDYHYIYFILYKHKINLNGFYILANFFLFAYLFIESHQQQNKV